MTPRRWPALLLVALAGLLLPAPAPAQMIRSRQGDKRPGLDGTLRLWDDAPAARRPSHEPVGIGLENNLRPQDLLERRLGPLLKKKQEQDAKEDEALQGNIQELARKLLKDEKFLDSLKGLSRQDAEKLLDKVGGGRGIGDDPALHKLLREGLAGKTLSEDQKDLAKRWSEKLRQKGVVEPPEGSRPVGPGPGPQPPPPPPPAGGAPPPPPPPAERQSGPTPWEDLDKNTPDWLKGRLDRWVKDFDKWVESPAGKSWRDALKNLARSYENNRAAAPAFLDRARSLSRYLPRVSDYVPRGLLSRLPRPRMPAVPTLGVPSAPAVSARSLADAGKAVVWVAALTLVAVLLWRAGGGWYDRLREARAAEWRLGPWPVRPEAVSTRGELVRAFEHLALLCLGRAARTHHHLDLGEEIGAQPSLDPDRRQDAARTLARLYEQARYAPPADPLPDAELERARRELCYLAGVSAA
jgi:hypothetical protein